MSAQDSGQLKFMPQQKWQTVTTTDLQDCSQTTNLSIARVYWVELGLQGPNLALFMSEYKLKSLDTHSSGPLISQCAHLCDFRSYKFFSLLKPNKEVRDKIAIN